MLEQEDKLPIQNTSSKRFSFEQKIQPILNYVGLIGACITALAYIIIVMVMIVGFKKQMTATTLIFAIINAVIGLIIMQLLKVQGISFAKNLPENKAIIEEYYKKDTKDKKYVSIDTFWRRSVIKDVIFKGVSVGISTAGLIFIVIVGTEDYNLLLLALTNLLMFTCFGLLALNKAYEFYNNRHVPYMIEMLRIAKESKTKPVVAEKPAATTAEVLLALENLKAAIEPKGEKL